ncbi:MAG: MMPL family transporter [Halanaerobiales bacterium]|nr:MMPL family transporter [Halanaerobiales bacterium]
MKNYVEFVKDHRKLLFIIFITINILAIVGLFRIQINPEFNIFMPEGSIYKETLDKMSRYFSTSDQISFLIETQNYELNPQNISEFRSFQAFLEKQNNINYINGPTPREIPVGRQKIELNNINEEKVVHLKNYYNNMGKLSTIYKNNNKLYASFTIFPESNFSNENLNNIENYLEDNNMNYYASGNLYMQQKIIDYILLILLFIPPTALILILLVFKTQMGSLKATLFSILPAGIAALWALGAVGWSGNQVSIITVLAPIFTIVIGSADGLHFVSHLQESQDEGKSRIESIINTLKMIGIPMIITTITSMIGFLSLLVMNTEAIYDLAIFASLGVFLAGIATWFVLPLFLSGNINLPYYNKGKKLFTSHIKNLWGKPSIIILIGLLLIASFGIPKINTEFNMPMVYRDFTSVHKSFEKIKEITGGSLPLYLLVKSEENPLKPENAEQIISMQNELIEKDLAAKTMSAFDIYSIIYSNFSNTQGNQYPTSLNQINMINQMAFSEKGFNPTKQFINIAENYSRVMIFPNNLDNSTLEKIATYINDKNNSLDKLEIKLTGIQYLMHDLNQNMLSNQKNTLFLAFAIVFLLLFVSLKKFLPAIISILPIGFTVLILFGFLGLSTISLNLFTATIFSITIGVGIDYAVHFTSVWMNFKKQGYENIKAVNKAYDYTARPIMANAFGLAIGLSALLMSPLRIHLYVSTLMWVSMISGVFLSLSFLPTLLKKLK